MSTIKYLKYANRGGAKKRIQSAVRRVLNLFGIPSGLRPRLKLFLGITKDFVSNVNKTNYGKRCLLVYIAKPFVSEVISDSHQNQWQAIEIARVIGTFGYDVDAINFNSMKLLSLPKGKYDLIIDIRVRGRDFWKDHANPDCKFIVYRTGSSMKFAYAQENARLHDLEQRRGVLLKRRRTSTTEFLEEDGISKLNAMWFIGNSYNLRSYSKLYSLPPVYFIKNNGYNFGWVDSNLVRDKHSFVFFASSGQVHKGLDLLLEIFGREGFPYNLYVCGSFMDEEDFCSEYRHELFERPNVFPVGFIDIKSNTFREITERCTYALVPSCSEARAGSVLTVMSAGVIPIVSKECGYDDNEVINLPDCKIETIERYIMEYAAKSDEWVKERSAYTLEIVRTRYSRENFTQSVHDAMAGSLKGADE